MTFTRITYCAERDHRNSTNNEWNFEETYFMRAIQSYLPDPRHTEVMRIFVQASPELAWEKVRHLDLSTISWIRFLFDLRTIADLFHHPSQQNKFDRRLGIDQITSHESGFILLFEEPGKELVVGAIGKFWHLRIPFVSIEPNEFATFHEPGWGKVA